MSRPASWSWLCVLIFLASCSNGTNNKPDNNSSSKSTNPTKSTHTNNPPQSRGVIGVSLLTLQNPFFKVIGDHITLEAKKHGYTTIVVSAEEDVAKQTHQIKDFIVKKVSAIVLSPCESRSVVPVIQEANAASIPVFTVDIPCREPGVKIATQICTDNLDGGRQAGQAMLELLGNTGGKAAILHYKQAESCRLRVQGFREVVDAHNAKSDKKIDIVAELEGGAAKDRSRKTTQDLLQSHPDLAGLFCINDPSALGARSALEDANKADQVKIVGFDGQPEGKQAIKDGKIYADPIQFPDKMGQGVVQAILKHDNGEDLPAETLIPTTLYKKADADADPELK